MKKIILLGLLFSMFILGGCGMYQNPGTSSNGGSKKPDTPAYKDEFTREFITSPKEVEEGFYHFKSMTNGYTMLFPVNAEVSKTSYERNKEAFETYSFGEDVKEENLAFYYKLVYREGEITNNIDINLELLSEYAGYDGEYEQFIHDGKNYYYAKNISTDGDITYYSFLSFIKSQNKNKAIRYFIDVTCLDNSANCNFEPDKLENRFLSLMKSVDFN